MNTISICNRSDASRSDESGWAIGLVLLAVAVASGESPRPKPPEPLYETRADHDPNGIGKFFLGREIAHVMGFQAAGWLERPEREKEEESSRLIKALDLKPGMVVADVGAGSGYHVFRMAPVVGPKGKVLAVDIQPEMLALVRKRMKQEGVVNVEPVRGTEADPNLPADSVDLILLVDVYHEFSHPYEMAATLAKALKPGGRMVFVEFRKEDEKVPIKEVHKMSERQVLREMAFHPLKHKATIGVLPWQHVIVFERSR